MMSAGTGGLASSASRSRTRHQNAWAIQRHQCHPAPRLTEMWVTMQQAVTIGIVTQLIHRHPLGSKMFLNCGQFQQAVTLVTMVTMNCPLIPGGREIIPRSASAWSAAWRFPLSGSGSIASGMEAGHTKNLVTIDGRRDGSAALQRATCIARGDASCPDPHPTASKNPLRSGRLRPSATIPRPPV